MSTPSVSRAKQCISHSSGVKVVFPTLVSAAFLWWWFGPRLFLYYRYSLARRPFSGFVGIATTGDTIQTLAVAEALFQPLSAVSKYFV